MIAFLPSLGVQEMLVLMVIGLLLYGRNLPEAGQKLGRMAAQLKRGFHDFKEQMDRDSNLRDVKRTLQDTARDVRAAAEVPRTLADPTRALRDLTNEALSSPLPDEPPAAPPAEPPTAPTAPPEETPNP